MRPLILALLLATCAPSAPYVWTRPIEDKFALDWFVDGPPLEVVAVNPTDHPVYMWVVCVGEYQEWWVEVPPRSEKRALTQVMNRDSHFDPCWLKEQRQIAVYGDMGAREFKPTPRVP
jgi:hypothetical protein